MSEQSTFDLLNAAACGMSAEEVMLAGLKGLIAAEISMKRQEKGLSQKEFADLMGVSQGLVSRWENGETNYTLETLVRIASKLGIPVQSPFELKAPPVYRTVSSNLIQFSSYLDGSSWSSCVSSPSGTGYQDYEEM